MADDRTQEQKEADAELDAAIQKSARVYGRMGADHVMTDFIVVAAGVGMTCDGDNTTLGFHLFPDGGERIDWHRSIGMLRAAQLRLEAAYLCDDD